MLRKIRDMTVEDIPQVLDLCRDMAAQGIMANFPLNEGRSEYVFNHILGDSGINFTGPVFAEVFEVDGTVRGFFVGQVTTHEFVQCHIGSDLGFYIDPDHREGTWGIRLIKNFEAWCMSPDVQCDMIKLAVFAGVANQRTADLLTRLGYSDAGSLHAKEI